MSCTTDVNFVYSLNLSKRLSMKKKSVIIFNLIKHVSLTSCAAFIFIHNFGSALKMFGKGVLFDLKNEIERKNQQLLIRLSLSIARRNKFLMTPSLILINYTDIYSMTA